MATEQQQPMSDARLEDCRKNVEMAEAERNRVKDMWPMSQEWHEADAQIAYLLHTTMTARDLLAEVERLRAREAALVKIAVGVARLDTEAGNGIECRCRLSVPFGHLDDCWVLEAQVIAHTTPDGEMDG